MKHFRPLNRKAQWIAARIEEDRAPDRHDRARTLADVPFGCSTQLDPGWEVDGGAGTYGLCTPVERDLYDCYHSCYWPAQVPDALTNFPDWTKSCGAPVQDWASIDLVFP